MGRAGVPIVRGAVALNGKRAFDSGAPVASALPPTHRPTNQCTLRQDAVCDARVRHWPVPGRRRLLLPATTARRPGAVPGPLRRSPEGQRMWKGEGACTRRLEAAAFSSHVAVGVPSPAAACRHWLAPSGLHVLPRGRLSGDGRAARLTCAHATPLRSLPPRAWTC